jgi:hypothetical protein
MNIFVSYTLRDGMVTASVLQRLHKYLSGVCSPFIHAVEERRLGWQQFGVLRALLQSDVILLVVSPAVQHSRWVILEMCLGRLLLRPVIRLNASDLAVWRNEP